MILLIYSNNQKWVKIIRLLFDKAKVSIAVDDEISSRKMPDFIEVQPDTKVVEVLFFPVDTHTIHINIEGGNYDFSIHNLVSTKTHQNHENVLTLVSDSQKVLHCVCVLKIPPISHSPLLMCMQSYESYSIDLRCLINTIFF